MYTIATLDDLRRRLGLSADDADSAQELLHSLQEASHLIESLTQRRYCPLLRTRAVPLDLTEPSALILPDDLLELKAIRDAGGSLDIADMRLLPSNPDEPASIVQLVKGSAFQIDGQSATVEIKGVWGWHDRWTQAWADSGDAVGDSALSKSAATIAVTDANASDPRGFSPRFQVGHLLRIEDEYLRVTAVDQKTNTLTVLRGVQGTAAAAHAPGKTIETYTPPLPMRDLVARYAELMMKSPSPLADEPSPLLSQMRRLTA